MNNLLFVSTFIVLILNFLVLVIGVFVWLKSTRKSIKLITIYLMISLIFQTYQSYLSYNHTNNIFLFHIYPILEFVSLATLLVLWNPSNKKYFITYGIIVGSFVIVNSLMMSINEFPATSLFVIYSSLAIAFFFFLGNELDREVLKEASNFSTIAALAFILYFASVLSTLLVIYLEEQVLLLFVHIVTQILFYIVLIIAFISEWFHLIKIDNEVKIIQPKLTRNSDFWGEYISSKTRFN